MAADEEAISELLSELETLHRSSSSAPLSDVSLEHLVSGAVDDRLWDLLAARNLPPAAILHPISASMDAGSLQAALAYLSLLLLPSSPLSSLFSPLPLLSLLRSLRLSFKPHSDPPSNSRKRKHSARSRNSDFDPPVLSLRVLESLESVLSLVRLDSATDGRRSLIETVVGILTAAQHGQHHKVPDQCFQILYVVISRPEHGDQSASMAEVLRSLAPIILSPSKTPSRGLALAFVTRKVAPLSRENEQIRKALMYLPRFLAVKSPEKSEPRALAVDAIMEVVKAMGDDDRVRFAEFVVKMGSGKSHLRLLAVDLFPALLALLPDSMENEDDWVMKCLEALVSRCSDSMGGIRARALTNMAQVISVFSMDAKKFGRLKELIASGNSDFVKLLRRRVVDEKAAVRKAALLLITKATSLMAKPVDEAIIRTMGFACSDPLVSIRKAALTALSEVFRRFPDSRVIGEWLHAVPRLIMDNETSIREECENLFLELVFDCISRAGKMNLTDDLMDIESLVPKEVLDMLSGVCDGETAPCIKKICASLGKKKKLKGSIASSLVHIISLSETLWLRNSMPIEKWTAPAGAWQLLSEVSLFTPKAIDWEFLHHHWQLFDQANTKEKSEMSDGLEPNSASWAGDRVYLLQTISNVSIELPSEPAADLAHNLLKRIEDFNMNLSEVDGHVKALKTLCKQKATNPEEGDVLILKWVRQLLSKAVKVLKNYMSEVSEASKVNSFLTPSQTHSGRRNRKKATSVPESLQQAVAAVFTVGSLILVCPSADLQAVIPLLHTILTSSSSEAKPKKLAGLTVSIKEKAPSLYTQSWVTFGKICLVDGKLAKRYIPLFVQELERSDCAALRNNIMVVMADFCVRYTALVDCYIPRITASLCDPCEVVRRQTFILLSRLLQRDYVKWRGVLFLRFLLSLVDESEKIRHLADFLFGSILKVKAPLLAYNSFVEAIFVLNDCKAHAGHSESQMETSKQKGPKVFSIRGNNEKSRSQRMHIYVSLLKQMAPEHLLATSAKLCAEILAAASDGLLNIDDVSGKCVLQDALQILACKEMRLHANKGHDTAEMDDESGDAGATLLAARGRVVTQVAKKNLIQIAVPIFIELKRLLQNKNSPLTGCLMDCLRVLLKDYKNEFDEILVADKQLQKELIYDIQKHEAAKAKSMVADAMASAQRSENHNTPVNRTTAAATPPPPPLSSIYLKVSEKLGSEPKIASAMADAAAKVTARSVLKEVCRNAGTPPLQSMSIPRLKSNNNGNAGSATGDKPSEILESLRRRQSFDSDDEN